LYLNDLGMICALGEDKPSVLTNLLDGRSVAPDPAPWLAAAIPAFHVRAELPPVPRGFQDYGCRANRLLLAALQQIEPALMDLMRRYGPDRTGVVIGTSTSGIAEGEQAVATLHRTGRMPETYHYKQQELGAPAGFLAHYLGIRGPAFTISTTCSSSANALATARRLLRLDVCDLVLTGGADALCATTIMGFKALELVSKTHRCNPFSRNRDGILIGEGAALFLMSREVGPVALLGVGASSDAYHISAPDPDGAGAFMAMAGALKDAGVSPQAVDYINLHGTGTRQNDTSEGRALWRLFGEGVPCGSSKGGTGHCLGAAGAIESGLCWLILSDLNPERRLPPHIWDAESDPELAPLAFVKRGDRSAKQIDYCLSNSFAFGGNNVSLLLGRH
jgi:3-oxoacyl-[acyl-carrier-protein] synthase-1